MPGQSAERVAYRMETTAPCRTTLTVQQAVRQSAKQQVTPLSGKKGSGAYQMCLPREPKVITRADADSVICMHVLHVLCHTSPLLPLHRKMHVHTVLTYTQCTKLIDWLYLYSALKACR